MPGHYSFHSAFVRLWCDRSGGTAIEYALIAALISVAIIGGASLVGQRISSAYYNAIAGNLT